MVVKLHTYFVMATLCAAYFSILQVSRLLFISSLPTRLSFQESFNVMSKPADFKNG